MIPNTSANPWYCMASGCDYTVRVTYADGSQKHVLLKEGKRGWFDYKGEVSADRLNATKDASYKTYALNVAGDKPLRKVELLDTPLGFEGLPENPTVLAERVME